MSRQEVIREIVRRLRKAEWSTLAFVLGYLRK